MQICGPIPLKKAPSSEGAGGVKKGLLQQGHDPIRQEHGGTGGNGYGG